MGMNVQSWDWFQKQFQQLAVTAVCELGNQYIRESVPLDFQRIRPSWTKDRASGKEGDFPAKFYFEQLGIAHTSIDWNGRDGALPLDLTKPIADSALRQAFDLITNFGTAEHVKDQYALFRNIHELCAVSGAMLHLAPLRGHWPKHSEHGISYTETFFRGLAERNNYRILDLRILSHHRAKNRDSVATALQRQSDAPFEPFETFVPPVAR